MLHSELVLCSYCDRWEDCAAGVGDAADVSAVPCENASVFSVRWIVGAPPSDLRERILPPKEFGGPTRIWFPAGQTKTN